MSDEEIYKSLRLSPVKRNEFIKQLDGANLERAYSLNNAMFDATMEGTLSELDARYNFDSSLVVDTPEEELITKMNDMELDFLAASDDETPIMDEDEDETTEEEVMEEETVKQEENTIDESSIDKNGVIFKVADTKPSDEALEKLKQDAQMISANAELKPMPKMDIEVK